MTENVQLQKVLQIFVLWSILWQLTLNICKSIVQHFGQGYPQYPYHFNNIALEATGFVQDLCVAISKDLTYLQHIKEIISASTKKPFITNKCFHFKNDKDNNNNNNNNNKSNYK